MSWLFSSVAASSERATRGDVMRYYQEVTLLPSQEIPLSFIWTKVYGQLHIGLVSLKDENERTPIGVSFPEYRPIAPKRGEKSGGLGTILRIFAREENALKALDVEKLIARLRDYVHISGIRPVPEQLKGYAVYRRFHQKKSVAQKARRYARRHAMDFKAAEKLFPQEQMEGGFPYIQMVSLTNRHRFGLFVVKEKHEQEKEGLFSVYGLSELATVPEF